MLKIKSRIFGPLTIAFTIYLALISCQSNIPDIQFVDDVDVNKKNRLELLLNSPLEINCDLSYFNLKNIKFKKEIFTISNKHFREELDTIVRYTSLNNSIIEIYKNDLMDKIIYLESDENNFRLNYGLHIGMHKVELEKLLPLTIDENNIARINDSIYEDFFNLILTFNKDNLLTNINYVSYIE
ncbi:MAG: hypothetical protein ACSHXF_04770 [Aquaticitalea sp.]